MHAILIRHLIAGALAVSLGLYLTPVVIAAAKKIGFLDSPDGRLKQHKQPVPYLGGIAVFLPFIATLGICYPFDNDILWLLLGSCLLLFVGLIDDFKALTPRQKFLGQLLASLCFLKGQFSLKTDSFMSYINLPFSLLWMLTVMNAFNLVDVMDGLCGTLALTAALSAIGFSAYLELYQTSLFFTALAGSLIGFLWYNKPHARIYLGDAGSLFIGGIFAAMPLLFVWPDRVLDVLSYHIPGPLSVFLPSVNLFFLPTLMLAAPLLEVCVLFIVRSWLGIPFYNGSPHHFALYLQRRGWSKWHVLGFASMLSAALIGVCWLILVEQVSLWIPCITAFGVIKAWILFVYKPWAKLTR